MKIKRIAAAIAVVGAGALILSGCSAPKSEIVENTSLSIAQNSAVTSLNANVASQYSTYNSDIQYMISSSFNYYDSTPKLQLNKQFGTYKLVSKSPLTVKYTINSGVKWSDGTPVDAADLLLSWASSLTKYNNPKGVNFSSIATGSALDYVKQVPKISDDNRSVTLVYTKPYVDWPLNFAFGGVGVPAHVTYQEAYPGKKISNADAQTAVIKAIQTNDTAVLTKLGKAWGSVYNVVSMPSDKKLLVSDGPYVVSAFVKDQYITLTANKNYTWGPLPKVQKITVRFIDDPTAQIQALQNGEVDIVSGQATTDTIKAVAQLGDKVKSSNTNESTYEHVDLSFATGSPFSPATYGGDATKAQEVRQAFLDTIPRQEIVDKLIKPLNPKVQLDNSQVFLPGAAGYTESVAQNGSSAYADVNIAEAKSLLAKAGVTNLTVKFGYPNDNPRRVDEFALIKASAAQAGITLTDDGMPSATYFGLFGNGSNWDANIYASQSTNLGVSQSQGTFQTAAGGNYNAYSNKTVDTDYNNLLQSLSLTPQEQQQKLGAIDKAIWGDAYGVTLYQLPDITAWSPKVTNVVDAPLSPTVFWNFWQWDVKK